MSDERNTTTENGPRLPAGRDWSAPQVPEADFELPMHVGAATYQKLPYVSETDDLRRRSVDVAILGAPLDEGDTNRPGARFGPRAIRLAQSNTGSIYAQAVGLQPFDVLTVVDAGDAQVEPTLLEANQRAVYRKVRSVVEAGAVPISLGGDHSITWPAVTAVSEWHWPRRIGVLHFDAHTDTSAGGTHGVPHHGTSMRRLVEHGCVRGSDCVQIGLRGYWPPPEVFDWMDEAGFHRHHMTEIESRGLDAVLTDAVAAATVDTDAVYLTVDVDVLEPAQAPGTGTPEPGGLLTRELLSAIRGIASKVRIAGMDVVEVSPPYDMAEVTAMTAQRCVLEGIAGLALQASRGRPIRFEAGRAAQR